MLENSTFVSYLREISKYPLLSSEEEYQLGLKIKYDNDKKARQKLINSNLRLVVSVAKTYMQNSNIDIMDLIQEGNIGLINAVERFDCEKGNKFSTYAVWWIKQFISRALVEQSHPIKLPANIVEETSKIKKAKNELEEQQEVITPEKISKKTGILVNKVIVLLNYLNSILSLDTPTNEDNETTIGDLVPDNSNKDLLADYIYKDSLINLMFILDTLEPREKSVIEKRFGFNGNRIHTLVEIGEELNLSKERVRQIEDSALRKLRNPMRSKMIKECLM